MFENMESSILLTQSLITHGAIHVLSAVLEAGCKEEVVRQILAASHLNAELIQTEGERRGEAWFLPDNVNGSAH